jgi:hypothetical protein
MMTTTKVEFTLNLPPPKLKEPMMKGQESKKAEKKAPTKTLKEKKEAKKVKKEEKQRQ